MEVNEEPIQFDKRLTKIKKESAFVDSQPTVKIEIHDGESKNHHIMPKQPSPTVKEEVLFCPSDLWEVKASDYFINTIDLDNIKEEIAEFDAPKTNLLTEHCELPTLKNENLNFDQPCSSKQAKEVLKLNNKEKIDIDKIIRKKKYPCPVCYKNCLSCSLRKEHIILHFESFIICPHCGRFFTEENLFLTHLFTHLTVNMYVSSYSRKPAYIDLTESSSGSVDNHSDIPIKLNSSNVEKHFQCDICFKKITEKTDFDNHLLFHSKNPLKCDICLKELATKFALKNHVRLHTVDNLFECDKCTKIFTSLDRLKSHSLDHTNEKQFQCKICSKKFRMKQDLKNHFSIHFKKSFDCAICSNKFTSKQNLINHLSLHSEKPQQCNMCPKVLPSKYSYGTHVALTHSLKKPYKCVICFKKCATKQSLKTHLLAHFNRKPKVQCAICSKQFITKHHLRSHLSIHSENAPQCKICMKKFTTTKSLEKHLRLHTGENLFVCETCSKSFISKRNYQKHIRCFHSDENPFKCKICSKIFNSNFRLKSHMSLHGLKLFSCNICLKIFPTHSKLLNHIKIHTGEHSFECKTCLKTFKFKQNFEEHLTTHNSILEISHSCAICSEKFAKLSLLKEHEKVHDSGKIFNCETCFVSFKKEEIYKQHLLVNRLEEPLNCETCLEPFTLKCHTYTHSKKAEPIECQFCLDKFNSKTSLIGHIRISHKKQRKSRKKITVKEEIDVVYDHIEPKLDL